MSTQRLVMKLLDERGDLRSLQISAGIIIVMGVLVAGSFGVFGKASVLAWSNQQGWTPVVVVLGGFGALLGALVIMVILKTRREDREYERRHQDEAKK